MNFIKRAVCLLLAVVIFAGLTACGKKKDDVASTESTASKAPERDTKFTIGNLTVVDIIGKLSEIILNDGLTLSLTVDGTDAELDTAEYAIKDSDGKVRATVTVNSDLENKAATFMVLWDYSKYTNDENQALATAAKTLVIAVWPDYTEDYMAKVEYKLRFETSFLNALKDKNVSYTANAVGSGYISAGMSSNNVYYTISYPNLVENV